MLREPGEMKELGELNAIQNRGKGQGTSEALAPNFPNEISIELVIFLICP